MANGPAPGSQTAERQSELAEQRRRSELEATRWKDLFDAVDARVVSDVMTAFANEMERAGRWSGDPPKTEVRASGSGIKSAGRFTVPGSVEGETRPVRLNLELFPTTGEKFIAHLEIGDRTERRAFEAAGFESESEEERDAADAAFRAWLDAQFEKLVRRRVRF